MGYLLFTVATIALMVFVLADVISGGPDRFKNLDKIMWVIIVILLPLVGSILWFLVGREYDKPADLGSFGDQRRFDVVRESRESNLSATERELAELDREIERHEKDARIRKLEEELKLRKALGDNS